jgi:hypothetical protein
MSMYQARKWMIVASLALAALAFGFFILGPVLGYPLRYSQAQSLLQIVLPVFLGYLGAATQFVFQKEPPSGDTVTPPPMMELLIKGPISLFGLMMAVAILAFGYSNRIAAQPGEGMNVEQLSAVVTAAMGLLAVTTNLIVSYLFAIEKDPSRGDGKKG